MYLRTDYTYTLPENLIAQEAIHPQHDAKLMVIDRSTGMIADESTFYHLDAYIPNDRVLFFNNSRVLPARIRLNGALLQKKNGESQICQSGEILFLQKLDDERFEALVRPGKKVPVGTIIELAPGKSLEVTDMTLGGRVIRSRGTSIEMIMREFGELPLPPYIEYGKEKEEDYQTAFAEKDGSVAAPTASLHFTHELLEKLPHERFFVTLHVGLGTFKPMDTDDIRDYSIHRELVEIDRQILTLIAEKKTAGKKIVAVGTTACRTLESLPYLWMQLSEVERSHYDEVTRKYWESHSLDVGGDAYISSISGGDRESIHFFTSIYLYPGRRFLITDDLITNFHLPESSLLVLVQAFLRNGNILTLYRHAISQMYRFFSFGDGMYIRGSTLGKREEK